MLAMEVDELPPLRTYLLGGGEIPTLNMSRLELAVFEVKGTCQPDLQLHQDQYPQLHALDELWYPCSGSTGIW